MTAAIIGAGVNGLTIGPPAGAQGLHGRDLRALPGAGRRDVDGRAGMAPAARRRSAEEVEQILDLGIDIHYNTEIGKDISVHGSGRATTTWSLISAGCQIAQEIGIPGEDLNGVVSGIGFLEDVNLGQEGCLGRQARGDRRRWLHLDGLRAHRAPDGRRAFGDDLSPLDPGDPGRGVSSSRKPRSRASRSSTWSPQPASSATPTATSSASR